MTSSKNRLVFGTITLACFAASHVLAHSPANGSHSRPDSHAPAGMMYEHMHKKGEWMLGYNIQRLTHDGAYYHGTKKVNAHDALLGDYSMLTDKHQMDMHMLHLMYAVSDDFTLMLMPMYMSMDMDMSGNPHHVADAHGGHHDHHSGGHGAHSHGVDGWGDTVISGSYRLFDNGVNHWMATLAFSAPTGDYKKKGSDGKPVHYGMQLGAGVWQVIPSITYTHTQGAVKFGAQVSSRHHLFDDRNDLGYYQGEQRQLTGWTSYMWNHNVSSSLRVAYTKTDSMAGHYNVSHNHSSPADIQGNYGGEQTLAGVGLNVIIPVAGGIRGGVEYMVPIKESLNGVQQQTKNLWNFSFSKAF